VCESFGFLFHRRFEKGFFGDCRGKGRAVCHCVQILSTYGAAFSTFGESRIEKGYMWYIVPLVGKEQRFVEWKFLFPD